MSRSRKVARWVALALIATVVLVAINLGAIVDRAMTPDLAFAAETPPPAPDYAMSASWSALPERVDLADRAPSGSPAVDPRLASADVFYVCLLYTSDAADNREV